MHKMISAATLKMPIRFNRLPSRVNAIGKRKRIILKIENLHTTQMKLTQ